MKVSLYLLGWYNVFTVYLCQQRKGITLKTKNKDYDNSRHLQESKRTNNTRSN